MKTCMHSNLFSLSIDASKRNRRAGLYLDQCNSVTPQLDLFEQPWNAAIVDRFGLLS